MAQTIDSQSFLLLYIVFFELGLDKIKVRIHMLLIKFTIDSNLLYLQQILHDFGMAEQSRIPPVRPSTAWKVHLQNTFLLYDETYKRTF